MSIQEPPPMPTTTSTGLCDAEARQSATAATGTSGGVSANTRALTPPSSSDSIARRKKSVAAIVLSVQINARAPNSCVVAPRVLTAPQLNVIREGSLKPVGLTAG